MTTARTGARARIALALAVLGATLAAAGGAPAADPPPTSPKPPRVSPNSPANFGPALSRVVQGRFFHTRISTVSNTNARRVGRSLASLRPTWVSGLIRYARNQYPTHAEARAYRQIRRIVRSQSPSAQFDVVLNAEQYRTPAAIRRTMGRLHAKLNNDGWFLDFFSNAFKRHPKMIRAAIRMAHNRGQWIGGNVFGLARHRPLPAQADYYSVQDWIFHLNLPAVRRLAKRKPIIYHLNNNPEHQRSGGCRFIKRLNNKQRRALLRRRAHQQLRYRFRFAYPVLYPECLGSRPHRGRVLYSFNAFRHPSIVQEIRNLLDRYQLP